MKTLELSDGQYELLCALLLNACETTYVCGGDDLAELSLKDPVGDAHALLEVVLPKAPDDDSDTDWGRAKAAAAEDLDD